MSLKTIALILFFYHSNVVHAWWKPFKGPGGPLEDGLSAGLDVFDNEMYIGRGYFRDHYAPGKLFIESTSAYGIGLYVENIGAEQYISSNIEYYAKEPTCDYDWVQSSNGQRVRNAVEYTTNQGTFYVGRVFAGGFVEVGKIVMSTATMYYGKGHQTKSYEVLICKPIKITTTTTSTTTCTENPITTTPANSLNDELLSLNKELSSKLDEQMDQNQRLVAENSLLKEKLNQIE